MNILIQRMREELVRRNYAATTIHSHTKVVEHFQQHIDKPLDQLGRWTESPHHVRLELRQDLHKCGGLRTAPTSRSKLYKRLKKGELCSFVGPVCPNSPIFRALKG